MSKGSRLRQLREEKQLTQEALAKLLHTKRQTISKYEKDIVTNIPSDRVEELARVLDTTPEYILGWEPMTKEEQKNSDAIVDITLRLQSDTEFFHLVKSIDGLNKEQFGRANALLQLFFQEAKNEVKD